MGLGAVAPAKVGPDSVLRLTIEIELELTDLFTEVIESIRLSPSCVDEFFIVTLRLKRKTTYWVLVHYIC